MGRFRLLIVIGEILVWEVFIVVIGSLVKVGINGFDFMGGDW